MFWWSWLAKQLLRSGCGHWSGDLLPYSVLSQLRISSAIFRSWRSRLIVQLKRLLFSFFQTLVFLSLHEKSNNWHWAREMCAWRTAAPLKNQPSSSRDLTPSFRCWKKKVHPSDSSVFFCENFGDRPPVTILGCMKASIFKLTFLREHAPECEGFALRMIIFRSQPRITSHCNCSEFWGIPLAKSWHVFFLCM